MRHRTRAGYRRTTLYQMFMPTYLSSDMFAPLEIGILTSTNHGGQVAHLPVNYASSLSSGLQGMFSSHTSQHQKLVPVSPVGLQSILYTYYCQIIFVGTVLSEQLVSNNFLLANASLTIAILVLISLSRFIHLFLVRFPNT